MLGCAGGRVRNNLHLPHKILRFEPIQHRVLETEFQGKIHMPTELEPSRRNQLRGAFGKSLDILACTPGTSVTLAQRLAWRLLYHSLLRLRLKLEGETEGFEERDGDSPMTKEYKRFMRKNTPSSK